MHFGAVPRAIDDTNAMNKAFREQVEGIVTRGKAKGALEPTEVHELEQAYRQFRGPVAAAANGVLLGIMDVHQTLANIDRLHALKGHGVDWNAFDATKKSSVDQWLCYGNGGAYLAVFTALNPGKAPPPRDLKRYPILPDAIVY